MTFASYPTKWASTACILLGLILFHCQHYHVAEGNPMNGRRINATVKLTSLYNFPDPVVSRNRDSDRTAYTWSDYSTTEEDITDASTTEFTTEPTATEGTTELETTHDQFTTEPPASTTEPTLTDTTPSITSTEATTMPPPEATSPSQDFEFRDQLVGRDEGLSYVFDLSFNGARIEMDVTYGEIVGYYSCTNTEPDELDNDGVVNHSGETHIPYRSSCFEVYVRIQGVLTENRYDMFVTII